MQEFPSLARANDSNGDLQGYEGKIAHVSEKDQLRRYEFWKQIKTELSAISCDKLPRQPYGVRRCRKVSRLSIPPGATLVHR